MVFLQFIPPAVLIFWGSVIVLIVVLVHVFFAFGVYSDALRLRRTLNTTILVNPAVWLFATVLGGVLVAAVYWILHHSTLNPSISRKAKEIYKEPYV